MRRRPGKNQPSPRRAKQVVGGADLSTEPPDRAGLAARRREVDLRARRPLLWAVCGLLVLAVGLVFGQTVTHDFVNWDDRAYVYENTHVRRGMSVEGVVWAFTTRDAGNWHPLTWMSHMLDCQAYGLWAGGHHLSNVKNHCRGMLAQDNAST